MVLNEKQLEGSCFSKHYFCVSANRKDNIDQQIHRYFFFFVRVNVIKKYYSNNNFSKQLFKREVKYTAPFEMNGVHSFYWLF